ncbi:MAG: NERD domain-containing protein [Bacillota bacterium]|nr:NERD domain-containing protein [Bacillota bacterium]
MLLKSIKQNIMSIGKSIDGPTFIKPFEGRTEVIEKLEQMAEVIKEENILESIKYELYAIKSGDFGEKNVEFELKNSYIPMLCLHNVYLEHKGLTAQMDYVIITSKFICILETKLLNGNIDINNKGEFTRTFKNSAGKTLKKEGMYSPITQNQRHVDLLQRYLVDKKLIKSTPVLSLVVLANPKTIVFDKYATKDVKNKIVRADQLKVILEKMMKTHNEVNLAVLMMQEIADELITNSIERPDPIIAKYEMYLPKEKPVQPIPEPKAEPIAPPISTPVPASKPATGQAPPVTTSNIKLYNALKQYRYNTSKAENVKAYVVFNNAQMEEIIEKLPRSNDQLLKISGFGSVKVEKYGDGIINLVKTHG